MDNKKVSVVDESFLTDHIYESGAWSRYLDMSLPKLFDKTININDYIEMVDCSNIRDLASLKSNQEKNIELNKEFTKSFIELKKSHEINGWSYTSTEKVREWKNYLAFNYLINHHFMYELKKRESFWSWYLIVISTICSTITVFNITDSFFADLLKYIITFLSVITSLIAAFMKKENFVERIKEMDRYIQKVGLIHVELEGILKCKPWNRVNYSQFYDKHYNDIVKLFASPPPMSPDEFKLTIYRLTVYNPELVFEIEPWFTLKKVGNIEYYHMSEFGREVIVSHLNNITRNKIASLIFCKMCCNIANKSKFMDNSLFNKDTISNILKEKKEFNAIRKEILYEEKQFNEYFKEENSSINIDV